MNEIACHPVNKNTTGYYVFKYNFDEEFRMTKLKKKPYQRRKLERYHNIEIEPKQKYPSLQPISFANKSDLVKLCKTGAIPPFYLSFYENLPCHRSINDRLPAPDITEEDGDSDLD